MQGWAQQTGLKYQIPSETAYFAKLALAIALHEVEQEVIDRQDATWIGDIVAMLSAQHPPSSSSGIVLPDGRIWSGMD